MSFSHLSVQVLFLVQTLMCKSKDAAYVCSSYDLRKHCPKQKWRRTDVVMDCNNSYSSPVVGLTLVRFVLQSCKCFKMKSYNRFPPH